MRAVSLTPLRRLVIVTLWGLLATAAPLDGPLANSASGAEGDEYELVLEKVGSARNQVDKALRDALSLDDDGVKEALGGLPAVLKTGITKSEADMLKVQILNAVGKGRVREQVSLKVRVIKPADPDAKPKNVVGGAKTPKGPGKAAPGKAAASVKRGDPPARDQAIAELEKLKYKVTKVGDQVTKIEPGSFFDKGSDDHLWLASGIPDLMEVNIYEASKITDVGLSYLGKLKRLTMFLTLSPMPEVTDEGLKSLAECADLGMISLQSPHITDKGLENLDIANKPRIWSLSLSGSKITDKSLAMLKDLDRLEVLMLNGCAITDSGLKDVPAGRLGTLQIANTKVTIAALDQVASFTELGSLTIGGPAVTDEWLKKLPQSLRTLDVVDSKVTSAGLAYLKGMKDLTALSLKNNKGVTKAAAEQLKQTLPNLRVEVE